MKSMFVHQAHTLRTKMKMKQQKVTENALTVSEKGTCPTLITMTMIFTDVHTQKYYTNTFFM